MYILRAAVTLVATTAVNKIDKALRKIDDGTYGFCEETNKPISIARLKARPIATLSIEAQEMHEKFEKIYKEKEY